ncbi:class I SAM-dependent methyltransferase [Cellulomonas cellasea]|uniref:SAM-dependent methyltransferase n=1 Tax=Cellulomonas cellasea TaxID=43670 RepID=A0A7W4UCH9_9CELL|nr:class I SAM-dependent methyltransferase [Cellulomonas cellasea]MBB2921675.1 SAM-dependent methyltransferase [Cellulomonas cellasea]
MTGDAEGDAADDVPDDAATPGDAAAPGGYDAELRRYDPVLHRAAAVRPGDRVLDLGCGAGRTTRDAARAAVRGRALGVDVSGPAIERARALARTEGLAQVTFEQGDAQVHPLPEDGFDLAISRFGTMFFGDPVAAFAHVRRALAPGGRLAMLVWQAAERNAWDGALRAALGASDRTGGTDATGGTGGPDPFSLGEPDVVRDVLGAAGFADVTLTDVREPLCFGPDVTAALTWVRGFTCTEAALAGLAPDAAERALDRVRSVLAAHLRDDGVWFDGRAWLVTARRAP